MRLGNYSNVDSTIMQARRKKPVMGIKRGSSFYKLELLHFLLDYSKLQSICIVLSSSLVDVDNLKRIAFWVCS